MRTPLPGAAPRPGLPSEGMRQLCPTSRCSHPSPSSTPPHRLTPTHSCRSSWTSRSAAASEASTSGQQQQHNHQPLGRPTCRLYDMHDLVVPYQQAWDWQHQLVADTLSSAPEGRDSDCVLLLQHAPVYTLGSGSTKDNLLFDPNASTVPLYRTERGGEVTYHGPGQLVMYPILNLQRRPHRQDLHWYLRSLEQVVIDAVKEAAGLEAERAEGLTGVWVGRHKVAAIGVRAKRWVTYHGLALNVVTDLSPFKSIVPCGIADRPVGSIRGLLEGMSSEGNGSGGGALHTQTDSELMLELRYALLDSFARVFDVELQEMDLAADLPGVESLLVERTRQTPSSVAGYA